MLENNVNFMQSLAFYVRFGYICSSHGGPVKNTHSLFLVVLMATVVAFISGCGQDPSPRKPIFEPFPPMVPQTPRTVSALPSSDTSMSLGWENSEYYEDGFKIYVSTNNLKPASPVVVLSADTYACSIPSLVSDRTYYFWVVAFNSTGDSAEGRTSQHLAKSGTPVRPVGLTVGISNTTRLVWVDNASDETAYHVFWSTDGQKPASPNAVLPANSSICSLSGLASGSYYFWVQPVNATGAGTFQTALLKVVSWTMVWSDEFNGTYPSQPSTADWVWETGASGWGNSEWENYTTSPLNSFMSNGNLIIRAIFTGGGWNGYTSARMKTQGKRYWKYGRVEARMKLPYGKGIWPAFWMMPNSSVYGGWPRSGEIDIMENIGNEMVYGTVHRQAGSGSQGMGNSILVADRNSQFHTYAVEWDAEKITWYVDNVVYHTYLRSGGTGWEWWPFDQDFYIIFNLAVGGVWPGYPDGTTVFPQMLIVDYVRVFQQL